MLSWICVDAPNCSSHDEIFNIADKFLPTMVVSAQAAVLPFRADVFGIRIGGCDALRLGTRRIVDAETNRTVQPVLQRRLRPRPVSL